MCPLIVSSAFMFAAGHESGESPDVKLIAANGEELHTVGEVELLVQMAGHSVLHQFRVVDPFPYPVLLGSDFKRKADALLDFGHAWCGNPG